VASPYPAPANRLWAGLLRSVLALLTPVTITLTTTPVVPNTTTTSDENDQAAEPITPPCRARGVRDQGSTTLTLRPRRVRCMSCGTTHVLLLGAVLPRRADTTAVIGTALQASARGAGYRRIASGIGRPASTVRRWVRALRDGRHVEWLRAQGLEWIVRLDREVLTTLAPEPTRLGEALTALAAAALTVRARLTPHVPPWTLIAQFTRGRLLTLAGSG
jgi:transposase-like protein